MKDRKLSPAYLLGKKVGDALAGVVHRLLRPHVGRIIEEMHERMEFEGECEDEDIPDCENCAHHGGCPFEPGTVFEYPPPPPGFVLVQMGPPDPYRFN